MRLKLEIGAALAVLALAAFVLVAYIQEREARLTAELTAKFSQQSMDARDKQRDSQLADLQSQLLKVKTPAQAIQALPTVIQLPSPLQQVTAEDVRRSASSTPSLPDAPSSAVKVGDLLVPQVDIQPLYAKLNQCKQDEIALDACVNDSKDLVKQRDAYRTALHGGTLMQRLRRNAKWLGLGVVIGGAGYAAARR